MGLANIPSAADGTPIPASDHNALAAALKIDLVPRNSSGNATANAGLLGTPTFPWKRADITTGYFVCGDVKMFHDYNGLLSPGQGWMKMNGDICNETNYDAIHGAGSWDLYIITSPLDGKYLPNANSKYPIGKTDTSQAGTVAITFVGNASHQVSLAHTHTGPAHRHEWYRYAAPGQGYSFDVNGNQTAGNTSGLSGIQTNGDVPGHQGSFYTADAGTGNTGSGGSATQNIQPESLELEFWMRII